MDGIGLVFQYLLCPGRCGIFVKFNPQSAFRQFPVMIDADIFDADIMFCEQGGDGRDGAGFVGDIDRQDIFCFDRTAGNIDKRLTIGPGPVEKLIERIGLFLVQFFLKSV